MDTPIAETEVEILMTSTTSEKAHTGNRPNVKTKTSRAEKAVRTNQDNIRRRQRDTRHHHEHRTGLDMTLPLGLARNNTGARDAIYAAKTQGGPRNRLARHGSLRPIQSEIAEGPDPLPYRLRIAKDRGRGVGEDIQDRLARLPIDTANEDGVDPLGLRLQTPAGGTK